MLDVRRLRVLREVAVHGSIAGAARALSFTPSAVSQQLSKLERESGVALVERGPRSIRLTEAGVALVGHANVILDGLAAAEADMRLRAEQDGRSLRIGSFPTAGAMLLPEALAAFSRRHPDTQVTVHGLDPLVCLERLVGRGLNLAVVYEYDFVPLPRDERLALDLLLEEPMAVVLARRHPLASSRSVPLSELSSETWIKPTPTSSCHEFTARACRAAGFEPAIGFEFDDYQTMQTLVATGAGVAFAPSWTLSSINPGVVIRPLAFRPPARRLYVARRTEPLDARLATLTAALHDSAAALAEPTSAARSSGGLGDALA